MYDGIRSIACRRRPDSLGGCPLLFNTAGNTQISQTDGASGVIGHYQAMG